MGNRSSSTRKEILARRMRKLDHKQGNTTLPKAAKHLAEKAA